MTAICNPKGVDLRQFHPPNAVIETLTLWARIWDQTIFLPFNMSVNAMMAASRKEVSV